MKTEIARLTYIVVVAERLEWPLVPRKTRVHGRARLDQILREYVAVRDSDNSEIEKEVQMELLKAEARIICRKIGYEFRE